MLSMWIIMMNIQIVSRIHRIAAVTAFLCVTTFFISTLVVELTGSTNSIELVKSLIVFPGLFILVPAIACAGATGFLMGKNKKGRIIDKKKKRMPFIAVNGLFILVPAAIFLNYRASTGVYDATFVAIQFIELLIGATNASLMFLNIKDGKKLTDKKRENHASN